MARIGPMDVSTDSSKYKFVVYDLRGPEYNAPGVYIFSKGTPNAQGGNNHNFLYIGQTESFHKRLNPNHEKWNEACRLGMNCISVYVPRPSESRFDIESSLIEQYKPPLNDLIKPFYSEQ